jgi:maleate isomerase
MPQRSGATVSPMRLGLMIPAVNTVAEAEFHAQAPAGVSVHTARLFPGGTTREAMHAMVSEGVPRATAELTMIHPDVVVFACTAAGAAVGEEGERGLIAEISNGTGAPTVSMNAAVQDALAATGAERIAVLTPYDPLVTGDIAAHAERRGMSVAVAAGLDIDEPFEWAALTAEALLAFAERELAGHEFDAILLSCANLRTAAVRDALTARHGVPVVTSNHAALTAALSALRERAAAA